MSNGGDVQAAGHCKAADSGAADGARPSCLSVADQAWVHALEQAHTDICRTRMAGLPVLHPGLHVEAVGFAQRGEGGDAGLVGVLITPWFMNLVWRAPAPAGAAPLATHHAAPPAAPMASTLAEGLASTPLGQTRVRSLGADRFAFIGAGDTHLGAYESCSLISPMFQFADQAAARATAVEVLRYLFEAASRVTDPHPLGAQTIGPGPAMQTPDLPRRGFLLGAFRGGAAPATTASTALAEGR